MYTFKDKKLLSRLKYVAKTACNSYSISSTAFTPLCVKKVSQTIYSIPMRDTLYLFILKDGQAPVFKEIKFSVKNVKELILNDVTSTEIYRFELTKDILIALDSFHRADYEIIQVKQNILGLT